MDGWMGWMEWMDGMDGWMGACMDGWMGRPNLHPIWSQKLPNLAPRGSKTLPREALEAPKSSQDRPRRHKDAPKVKKNIACKMRLQKNLSWARNPHPLGHHFGSPRVPKRGPRGPQEMPKSSQEASRSGFQNRLYFSSIF